jgi:hypothetical protein
MTDADDNICPECPHDLDDHTLDENTGLLECDLCECGIDPAEHDIEIEDDDDFLDDEESEDDDDYDQDDDDDEENRGEPATPARFPGPVPA